MIAHYFTLKALATDWNARFSGAVLGDVFTQTKGELTLGIGTPEGDHLLRVLNRPGFFGVFRSDGFSRARRNVKTMFPAVIGQLITGLEVADRDRFMWIRLRNGFSLQLRLFGPYPNVYVVDANGQITDAFKSGQDWVGKPAPSSRPADHPTTQAAFEARWHAASGKSWAAQLRRAVPFLDETLAAEVLYRLHTDPLQAPSLTGMFRETQKLLAELAAPHPCVYWEGQRAYTFSLIPLTHLAKLREERFETTDEAIRVFFRRKLAQTDFDAAFEPLEKALRQTHQQWAHKTGQMLEELAKPSRAARYEEWGHLLMAAASGIRTGEAEVTLPNYFQDDVPEQIPLDPLKSAVGNAQGYYEKARKTRAARLAAEVRWEELTTLTDQVSALYEALRLCQTAAEVEKFRQRHQEALSRLVGHQSTGTEVLPFRRFQVRGYDVWVGRNARENDVLTFQHARKHDLWLHARGVPGSHVVLRRAQKTTMPPKAVLEQAAQIAAHFSQARTSGLVPVQLTERKFVRKLKNGAPGQVLVEREQVLLVEPRLPADTQPIQPAVIPP